MANLNDAIQLIREGRKEEARLLLEALLKTDPKNVQAWFWYVETISSVEKRIQILEVCQKVNPGNAQVIQALEILRSRQSASSRPASMESTYASIESATPPKVSPFTSSWQEEEIAVQPTSSYEEADAYEPNEYDPALVDSEPVYGDVQGDGQFEAASDGYPEVSAGYKPAFDWDALEKETAQKRAAAMASTSLPPLEYAAPVSKVKPERVERKSYPFYLVWLTALFPFDLGTFSNMLDDPEATPGHAFEWTAIMGVIVGLITPLYIILMPEFRQKLASSSILSTVGNSQFVTAMIIFMVVMAVATPIFSILGLALNGALLNFLAAMFGGRGSYQRTVYALGAFSAPYLLIYAVISMLPVLQYVSPFLGLYSFFCSMRALMAAHDLSTWDAIKTMLAPTVLIIILGCVGIVMLMLTSSSGLPAR